MSRPATQTNEEVIWKLFMNAPAAEALQLFATAQKILAARNIMKLPRKRKGKDDAPITA